MSRLCVQPGLPLPDYLRVIGYYQRPWPSEDARYQICACGRRMGIGSYTHCQRCEAKRRHRLKIGGQRWKKRAASPETIRNIQNSR